MNTLPDDVSALQTARLGARCLTLYRNILDDPACQAFLHLLDLAGATTPAVEPLAEAYHRLIAALAVAAENAPATPVIDAWQGHLLHLILEDENPFSRQAEHIPLEQMGVSLREAAAHDLRYLQCLFQLDACVVHRAVTRLLAAPLLSGAALPDMWTVLPTWEHLHYPEEAAIRPASGEVKLLFCQSDDWTTLVPHLAAWYESYGTGIFSRYPAFRWVRQDTIGRLHGIASPDSVQLQELIGYQTERSLIIQNTEQFLQGYPANNILLYGDRGTGKSSTVKALLNEYSPRGLRLIEVSKYYLADFPEIFSLLRRRCQKFILFIDDLSFEENEVSYKDMKAVLEGGVESRPANVLIYATSNRRHLIKERFADRNLPDDEVRESDTLQEKLSLSDRFGITVIFPTPDQEGYLSIVEGLARQRQLPLKPGDLRQRALQWQLWHNGYSGRTARQFIDHLTGELATGNFY